ncbi:1,4-alpha-glucan branching protein GlgB [Vibrio aestuarianus]|uniref:1,4-alpha-glucan branching enzyme GlgB n=1 Tax=Vibrio aestuarianus TaxID=28171 RepID=A0A9X4FCJ6_9VIBR|nr:1,4-alpha-glucan branching protein GlgB [Vibrio aestuarianus]MDE1235820.1 1,4-alpha-glucan branching protein GlgB [Vibrio aestuarianus]MDE1246705.1 1,4-alpha-glucan branching protein GlgB [Vibrio aestuarianus]MDE1347390.1 1,4-alpha-glucan branching protein GlgB [Vibrio aestuarianus]NGZ64061.1 1,4-alpha-glucan branching protein GlgB [Vibrio aestuarianus subsp. cardii]NGZ68325.1 1,4-alpha-glucan branching protein GlgB [Vibrio aestuarianus subsp. cardii]
MKIKKLSKQKQVYSQLYHAAFADPFSFLGPYLAQDQGALRVWMPGADKVELVIENQPRIELEREEESGFVLKSDRDLRFTHYQLAIDWAGTEQLIDDPYQYHSLYAEYDDLHTPKSMYHHMGSQFITLERDGKQVSGTRFLVYAPHAQACSLIGAFNDWDGRRHPMQRLDYGIWGIFMPDLAEGTQYKFELKGPHGEGLPHKADPWGFYAEQYPSFASVTYDHSRYQWQDSAWQTRPVSEKRKQALSFYELHVGSWRRNEQGEFLNYRELAEQLVPYLVDLGYTHVELMPVSEHPFYGSWGYQPVGLFAPTSRFGTPDDFKYFVEQCHLAGIGVVLDWVPAHFPADSHGLANFDGTPLFHDPDPRRGWHQDWNSYIYDLGREHVRRFLVSNALYWFEQFHIDGIRVDAVASMLYLDYSRSHDQWIPNVDGGRENYDAIATLKWMNEEVYKHFPNAMTIAEESTAFPGVSAPTFMGGLGFGFKWNMGWMHDSLAYIQEDPVHRKYHHNTITFPLVYAHSENYVLSLSHDEVVYGKGSIHNKMPGDEWQQTANLRAYMGYMYGQPGKKLNFMGAEIGQTAEWNHDDQLQWFLLQFERHQGVQNLTRDLNKVYQQQKALFELDSEPRGFEWRLQDAADASILAHERISEAGERVLIITNFTPVPHEEFQLGMPIDGEYQLLLNTDDEKYGGSGFDVLSSAKTEELESEGLPQSLLLRVPPLATIFYKLNA